MARANHRSAVKPRRLARTVRRAVTLNGRHHAATRAATHATATTTGGQKIDYTRGRWPQAQSFAVKHHTYTDQVTSYFYPTVVLTQDADGKSLVDLDLSTYPNEEGKALLKYEVVRSTGQTVATGTFATAPIVELTAPTPGDVADYVVYEWLDKNNDNVRDAGEDVKTLAAQQAKNVITVNNQNANIPATTFKQFTVTVMSGNKPVANVNLDSNELQKPAQLGALPIYHAILITDNNGQSVFTIESPTNCVQGNYAVSVYEGNTYATRVAEGVLNFNV